MARKFGKINVMRTNFDDYNYAILGQGGIGKTTMAYEIGKIITGSDEGTFIITLGMENKTNHIPNAFSEEAPTFDKYLSIVEDLVENRSDYPDTKFIAPDSIDELFRLAEDYVVDEYNQNADLDKRAKSIKQVYGGYQAGENKVVDLVVDSLSKLDSAGYKFIYIGHTKTKSKTDPITGISYEQYTCSVDNKYYLAIKDKVNVVATGYFERDFSNIKKKDNPYTHEKNAITTGELVGQRRVISFVDDDNAIDTKCHFEYIVPKTDFSAQSFINAVKEAIQKKIDSSVGIHNSKPLPEPSVEELNKMRVIVREKFSNSSDELKKKVFTYMKENRVEVDNANEEQLTKLIGMFD